MTAIDRELIKDGVQDDDAKQSEESDSVRFARIPRRFSKVESCPETRLTYCGKQERFGTSKWMHGLSNYVVVDASVLIKWLVDEKDSDSAQILLEEWIAQEL